MIVLSAGMQKSGTGWYFNLTNELLASHGGHDTRALLPRSVLLRRVVRPHNCTIGNTRPLRMVAMLPAHLRGRRFAVKTHGGFSPAVRALSKVGALRATYCYRDLRDVALSAFDHRQKWPSGDGIGSIETVEDAFRFAATLVPKWRGWTSAPGVLTVRYEDLRVNPEAEIARLAEFLDIDLEPGGAQRLLEVYPAGAESTVTVGRLHFNQGEVGRYREILGADELRRCDQILGPLIDEMGYERG